MPQQTQGIAETEKWLRLWVRFSGISWLESQFVVTRTRLESRQEKWWLGSIRVTFFTQWLVSSHIQWLETRVRVIFTKSLSSWWTNPVRLHTKKWAFFASVMIKTGVYFLFCLSSCAMLHFKDQVSTTCIKEDLRLCFHWGVSRAQYIDTLSWFKALFAINYKISYSQSIK